MLETNDNIQKAISQATLLIKKEESLEKYGKFGKAFQTITFFACFKKSKVI